MTAEGMVKSTAVGDFLKLLEKKEVKVGSAHGLRNEQLRKGSFARRFGKVKTEVNRSSVLLFPKDIALTWDPNTGEESEDFNANKEWRLDKTASFSAKVLKAIAHNVPATKERLMKEAGVSSWDTSDFETLTKEDEKIFKPHLVKRVYSRPVVYIKSQTITGRANGVAFSANLRKNEFDKLIDEEGNVLQGANAPKWVQIKDLETGLRFQEWLDLNEIREAAKRGDTDWESKIKNKRPEYEGYNLATIPEDKFLELKHVIMRDVLVTDDRTLNEFIAIEIETESNDTPKEMAHFKNPSDTFLDSAQKIMGRPRKLGEHMIQMDPGGKLVSKDNNFNFLEVYRQCPSEYNGPENDKKIMLLAGNTTYQLPPTPISEWKDPNNEDPIGQRFLEKLEDFLNQQGDLEDRYIISTGLDEFNEYVQEQLEEVFAQSGVLNSPYMTPQLMRRHARLLEELFADEFLDKATEMELGIVSIREGSETDVEEAAKLSKEANKSLSSFAEEDDLGDLEEEEAENIVDVPEVATEEEAAPAVPVLSADQLDD